MGCANFSYSAAKDQGIKSDQIHADFSTNHLAGIDKTEQYYDQEQPNKNLQKHTWFEGLLCNPLTRQMWPHMRIIFGFITKCDMP